MDLVSLLFLYERVYVLLYVLVFLEVYGTRGLLLVSSVRPSACLHGKTRLPLDGLS